MTRADPGDRLPRAYGLVIIVLFAVGMAGHLVPAARQLMAGATWIALLLNAALVLAPLAGKRHGGVALWFASAYAAGFGLEVIGVATGWVFGSYAYGTVLGPLALRVPLVIGINWALIILGSITAVVRAAPGLAAVPAAVLAGLLTVLFDFVMEPVAVARRYWTWEGGAIPLRNYAAWFVISAALALPAAARLGPALRTHPAARLAMLSTAVQLAFFFVLRFALA